MSDNTNERPSRRRQRAFISSIMNSDIAMDTIAEESAGSSGGHDECARHLPDHAGGLEPQQEQLIDLITSRLRDASHHGIEADLLGRLDPRQRELVDVIAGRTDDAPNDGKGSDGQLLDGECSSPTDHGVEHDIRSRLDPRQRQLLDMINHGHIAPPPTPADAGDEHDDLEQLASRACELASTSPGSPPHPSHCVYDTDEGNNDHDAEYAEWILEKERLQHLAIYGDEDDRIRALERLSSGDHFRRQHRRRSIDPPEEGDCDSYCGLQLPDDASNESCSVDEVDSQSSDEHDAHTLLALSSRTQKIMSSFGDYISEIEQGSPDADTEALTPREGELIRDYASHLLNAGETVHHRHPSPGSHATSSKENNHDIITVTTVPVKTHDGSRKGRYVRRGSEGSLTEIPLRGGGRMLDILNNFRKSWTVQEDGDSWNLNDLKGVGVDDERDCLDDCLEAGEFPSKQASGHRYAHPLLHGVRFRRVVLGAAVLCMVCILVGVLSSRHSAEAEEEPGWIAEPILHQEAANDLPHHVLGGPARESNEAIDATVEEGPHQQQQQHSTEQPHPIPEGPSDDSSQSQDEVAVAPSPQHVNAQIIEESEPSSIEGGSSASTGSRSDPVAGYDPTWYDRSDTWEGRTYIDAIAFCASRESKIPCPYDTICPEGPGGVPTGGSRQESEIWAPIIDAPNAWVSVGADPEASCRDYNSLHTHPPIWGVSNRGDRDVDHTPSLMCCRAPLSGEVIERSDHIDGSSHINATLAQGSNGPANAHAATNTNEQDALDKLHPIWFSREHGYHGTTHQDAADFCKSMGDLHLCPREAYCPDGPGVEKPLFLQRDAFAGEQWAPVAHTGGFEDDARRAMDASDNDGPDSVNEWVLVGTVNGIEWSTCMTYDQIHRHEHAPEWGVDGTRTELKENVLCCQNPSGLLREQHFANNLDPIWLDSSHGWNGGSHDDAMKFCSSLGRRKLCPYTAYCPHGPGSAPMGGHQYDFNEIGEQWAPVYGNANKWVQIGRKWGNSATTCMENFGLEGGEPYWGSSDERADLKEHIMCCSF